MWALIAAAVSLLGVVLIAILLVRFQKRRLAAFHRAFTNKIAVRFAARIPGFGVVTNIGRKSGKIYRTPVNVFRSNDGFLIALTYGSESGWVKNVLAAGCCQLETLGVKHELSAPTLVHDPSRRRFPLMVRLILGAIAAHDYLQLEYTDRHNRKPNAGR